VAVRSPRRSRAGTRAGQPPPARVTEPWGGRPYGYATTAGARGHVTATAAGEGQRCALRGAGGAWWAREGHAHGRRPDAPRRAAPAVGSCWREARDRVREVRGAHAGLVSARGVGGGSETSGCNACAGGGRLAPLARGGGGNPGGRRYDCASR
jgi:hypothetical protein